MSHIPIVLRRTAIGFAAIVQLLFFPVTTFAETPSNNQPAQDTAADRQALDTKTGPSSPTGADASTYTFNAKTGLWENEHYTWDPKTKQTTPKKDDAYTYNPATGTWDTKEWKYDNSSKTYKPNSISQDKPTSTANNNTAKAESPTINQQAIDSQQDSNQSVTLDNKIATIAKSGNAAIKNNTSAGSASTGNAHATSNTLSMLQSSWGLQGSPIATFDSSIHGDVVGDLLLDPAVIATDGLKLATTNPSNLDLNIKESGTINNNIIVGAKSGNADVVSNTSAGSATTGGATALANVINLISSAIHTGQSFIGNINIRGSLEGDILLPESIKSKLTSGDSPTTTSLDTSTIANGEILREFTTNQNIHNDVHLSAQSGQAINSGNSQTGGATSGDGKTNLTLINLTGKEVIGSNALLVFVNVLGKWTGMIVDAPAGATTGMIGSHTTEQRTLDTPRNSSLSTSRDHAINNTIIASAQSGDATISQNTKSGTASTGDARTGINLLNITDSKFSLADWFGVLFINVFGSWNGSFGMNTPMGDRPTVPIPSPAPSVNEVKVYTISGDTGGGQTIKPASMNTFRSAPTGVLAAENTPSMASSPILNPASTNPELPAQSKNISDNDTTTLVPAIAAVLLGAALLLIERVLSRRKTSAA